MSRRPAQPSHGAAWITGASSGIGAALARELADRGWLVALSARSQQKLEKLASDIGDQALPAPCDVSDLGAVKQTAQLISERFSPIGLVISNAGIYLPFRGDAFDADAFRTTIDVNLIGAANLAAVVLPDMAKRGEGHFHIVSSATGYGGMPTCSAYGASKAALINMAECLKIEMEQQKVGISVSTPGFVDTPAQDETPFDKPFMISAEKAARHIADAVERGGFETSFPRRFTWILKAIYALPKRAHIPIVRRFTGG